VWFKTRCTSPAGAVSECLLLPDFVNQEDEIGVMLPANVFGPTHKVVTKDKELVVRLMVVVGALDSRNEFSVDPFDFYFENGKIFYSGVSSISHAKLFHVKILVTVLV
jgi:hypothetical protein